MSRPDNPRLNKDYAQELINQDPRLGVAIGLARPHFEISREVLSRLTPDQIAETVIRIQTTVYDVLKERFSRWLLTDRQPRTPSAQAITDFMKFQEDNGTTGVLLMRHGTQELDEETSKLTGSALKIAQMTEDHNENDPTTIASLAEAAGTAFTFASIQAQTDIPMSIRTSVNLRSSQVAIVMGKLLHVPTMNDYRLKCLNYPKQLSRDKVNEILGTENNGKLVWDRSIVDRIEGEGGYQRRVDNVTQLIEDYRNREALITLVGHTQEINQAQITAGHRPGSLAELGFIVFSNTNALQMENGFYEAPPKK